MSQEILFLWQLATVTDKGECTSMKHQHSNSTTDFDREKSLHWSRKTESTRVCCQLLRISEVECQQNFAITQGPVHHVQTVDITDLTINTHFLSFHFSY